MTTIDKLDISVYNLYAIRTKMIEQINSQYRLDQASTIPAQLSIVDTYPKLTELDLLLGIVPLATPWAYFYPPKKLRFTRRSSFSFFRAAPTLGTLQEQEEDFQTLTNVECNTPEEASEKEAISGCFSQLDQINGWMGFIMGRVGQFLQG